MNPKDRITRLEALLERVQGRKLDARELAATSGSPSAHEELSAEDVTLDAELDADDESNDKPAAETGWSIPAARTEVAHAGTNGMSTIPAVLRPDLQPDLPSEPMLLIGDDATNLDDYEVAETVELDADGDDDAIHHSKAPPAAPAPVAAAPSDPPEEDLLESRQRLVSAMPFEGDEDGDSEPRSIPLVQRRPSQIPADLTSDPAEPISPSPPAKDAESLEELELLEEAPPSSRRPIVQQLTDLDDFEQDLAPARPPESGRQIAAQEDSRGFEDDFSSGTMPMLEPPANLNDMSIALEPVSAVIAVPQDAMEMVLPTAQSPGEYTRSFDGQPPAADVTFPLTPSARPGPRPEIVNADLVSTSRVSLQQGAPPSFSPATFGELLDAALSL